MPEAIRQLSERVRLNSDSAGLRLKLVDALDSFGAYAPAMAQMDSLIRKDSLNYGFWYRKALLQEKIKDTTGALRSYRYAVRIYPAPDAILAEANLLAERRDIASLQLCQQVLALRMGREYTAHCQFISGVYYARTGDPVKAIHAFNQCISNDFNYTEAYMEKGFVYYEHKQTAQAFQVFQTLVTIKNTYADGYYWRAKCFEAMGNNPAAIADYREALTLDPKLNEARDAMKRLGVK